MKLFNFELKRFVVNKRNLYLLTIISLLIVGYVGYQTLYYVNAAKSFTITNLKQGAQYNINEMTKSINDMKGSIKTSKNQAEINGLNSELESQKASLAIYTNELKALNAGDYNTYYKLHLQDETASLAMQKNEESSGQIIGGNSTDNIIASDIAYMTAVQNRKLDFEIMGTMQFHSFGNFQQQFLPILTSSLFIVLFASMVSITIATSFENKESRFYHFLAINSREDLLAKVSSGVLATFGWIILAGLVYFIVIGVINGFGAWNYPAYLSNNVTVENGLVDGVSLLYMLPIILFLASFGALISALAKRSMVVVGAVAIIVLGYSMIENVKWMKPLQKFIPMSYMNPLNLLNNPSNLFGKASIYAGLVYLLALSVIFLIFANLALKNQKLRRI